jgi:hypothetical protein
MKMDLFALLITISWLFQLKQIKIVFRKQLNSDLKKEYQCYHMLSKLVQKQYQCGEVLNVELE